MEPVDPNNIGDGESEFSWGGGMFPPGIAKGEGQTRGQDDFGEEYPDMGLDSRIGDQTDNYARAVADRRTDPTDPESGRDFEAYGNPDRFGKGNPLITEAPQPNRAERREYEERRLERG